LRRRQCVEAQGCGGQMIPAESSRRGPLLGLDR
jgi:hypothetical protein